MVLVTKLQEEIDKTRTKLQTLEDKLYKLTPHKPSVHTETNYEYMTKGLVHSYTYFCSYCGERIRKNSKKHKCGQLHDWAGLC